MDAPTPAAPVAAAWWASAARALASWARPIPAPAGRRRSASQASLGRRITCFKGKADGPRHDPSHSRTVRLSGLARTEYRAHQAHHLEVPRQEVLEHDALHSDCLQGTNALPSLVR